MGFDKIHRDLSEWIDCNIYGLNYCLEKVKLISLISEVFERLPSEDREILMYNRAVRFIAPITKNSMVEQIFIDPISHRIEQNTLCRCSKCNELHFTPKNGRYEVMVGIWLICLSSDILKRSKEESLYIIAHELAHVYLELPKIKVRIEKFSEREREVDKQLIKWNFESELRKTSLNCIHGKKSIKNESYFDTI
jgi:predicted metallopeptidase